jgi:hypothetical protein
MFLISRYDTADDRIRWLCPKCHAFEGKEVMIHQPMEFNDDQSSSDDELMAEDFPVDGDDNNDDNVNVEFENVNEEDERSYQMDSGIIAESKEDENDSPCTNGEATDSESMDEESDNVSYDLEYQKNKAVKQLSTIFGLFNIDPIHDK